MENLKIGAYIRDIRIYEKNYRQSFMAQKLNISLKAYSNIENNISDITVSRLCEIASIFDCTPTYILHYKEVKNLAARFPDKVRYSNTIEEAPYGLHTELNASVYYNELLLACKRKRIELLSQIMKIYHIEV